MKKRTYMVCIGLLSVCTLFAKWQDLSHEMNIEGIMTQAYHPIGTGTPVVLEKVIRLNTQTETLPEINMVLRINGSAIPIPLSQARYIEFAPKNAEEYWQCAYLQNDMYKYYRSKGYNRGVRQELIEESQEYLKELAQTGLIYEDEFIQDYARSLLAGMTPKRLPNKRPETFSVKVIKSPAPDAYMLPGGTLLLTTGLLSTLDSEEELKALVASEISHFVLDHALQNVIKAEKRARRSEFWGAVAAAAVEATEIYLIENHENYVPGLTTLGASVVAVMINEGIARRMGMVYNPKQQEKADQLAEDFLKYQNIPRGALCSALNKIKEYYVVNRDYTAISKGGNYEDLDKRISRAQRPEGDFYNRNFSKFMSGVTTFNAIVQVNSEKFQEATRLANKNVQQNFATWEDYLVLAQANMGLYSDDESNMQTLELLEKAKQMCDVPVMSAIKQEALLMLRMNKQTQATAVLRNYLELLDEARENCISGNEGDWIVSEINWTNKLLDRITLF